MSEVPDRGAVAGVPRHVLALVLLVLVVLGFAVGGSLRTALASPPAPAGASGRVTHALPHVPTASPRIVLPPVTDPVAGQVTAPVRRVRRAPAGSGQGRRIVYRESTMHLWVVGADGAVLRDYPVTGRPGWPRPGTYHVFAKDTATASPTYGVTFRWMVRFAHGHALDIGFHDIPRWIGSGRPIQSERDLGAPIGHGGCVRQTTAQARWLFGWASIGTTVVVLA